MPFEIGKTIIGKIVEVTERGLIVSLSDRDRGLVPASASLSLEAMMEQFSSGAQVRVLIAAKRDDGSYSLSIAERQMGKAPNKFDQEFARLNEVLTNHTPSSAARNGATGGSAARSSPKEEASIEERMKEWIAKAEQGLARLRKNRGKRLSDEFYDKH
ncbi:hypothetical protein J7J63_08330 [Candidatus Bipolaricaulota bacterium]|nr:hypothetical protein [Candidatus Bipolaricaulota bacterium]